MNTFILLQQKAVAAAEPCEQTFTATVNQVNVLFLWSTRMEQSVLFSPRAGHAPPSRPNYIIIIQFSGEIGPLGFC